MTVLNPDYKPKPAQSNVKTHTFGSKKMVGSTYIPNDIFKSLKIRYMTNKRFLLPALFTVIISFAFIHCNKEEEKQYHFAFEFITEDYKPFNYSEGGSIKGLAPDLLKEICDQLNIPYQVSLMPWEDAYIRAQSTPNAVLFSTSLNAERKNLFKWAGPFASLEWNLYSDAGNHINLRSLEDAKQVGAIGVIRDYTMEQYLLEQGFTNLVYCEDNKDAFEKLLQGEIDLFPSDKISAEAALNALGRSIYHVSNRLPIRTELLYFAFNPSVPDDVVRDIQQEINRLKDNGLLRALSLKYLKSADVPDKLQIYTEDYPPLTFMNKFGEITGFGSDIVYEIMGRNQQFYNIKLSTWRNGYELALINPDFCLFTMDRTGIREQLFQWVGPIGTNDTYFFTKAGSGITINSIEDAKNLAAVGTVSSWFSDQHLRGLGFNNLVSENNPAIMTQKLLAGEIDAFVCSALTFPDILREQGYTYDDVVPAFVLMSSDFYIAFSTSTSTSIVDQWQATLDAMQDDGTYEAIHNKWFPELQ
jgi:ABC-type amino acid transport substrate-binding protein